MELGSLTQGGRLIGIVVGMAVGLEPSNTELPNDNEILPPRPLFHIVTPIGAVFRDIHHQTGCTPSLNFQQELPGLEGLTF